MQGVTTAIVGFILLALAFPGIIKRSAQYYLAVGVVLAILVLDGIAHLSTGGGESTSLSRLVYMFVACLQVCGIILLILCTGGLSAKEFAANMARGYEVLRHGEQEARTVNPSGPRSSVAAHDKASRTDEEEGRVVYTISTSNPDGTESKKEESGSLPLE